jgi:flagellar hook-basal body complex protein FliE
MSPISPATPAIVGTEWTRPILPKVANPSVGSDLEGIGAPGSPQTYARFGDVLTDLIRQTDQAQRVSGETTGALLAGQNVPVHQAMIAGEEASVSFQLMLEVRNRLLEGYQELMRMQV